MKKIIELYLIVSICTSCVEIDTGKTGMLLQLLKNEKCNNQNIAIFKVKRMYNLKYGNISPTDTLTINGEKMDSIIYAITPDTLSTRNVNYSVTFDKLLTDLSCDKVAHLKKIAVIGDFGYY